MSQTTIESSQYTKASIHEIIDLSNYTGKITKAGLPDKRTIEGKSYFASMNSKPEPKSSYTSIT